MKELSPLQKERLNYIPKLPASLQHGINKLVVNQGEKTQSIADQKEINELFKRDIICIGCTNE